MDNVNFLVTEIDSYWSRDYGPWYVAYGEDQIGIVDFIYNRPNRPNDNAIPSQMAEFISCVIFRETYVGIFLPSTVLAAPEWAKGGRSGMIQTHPTSSEGDRTTSAPAQKATGL